jgi:hypothetical protein
MTDTRPSEIHPPGTPGAAGGSAWSGTTALESQRGRGDVERLPADQRLESWGVTPCSISGHRPERPQRVQDAGWWWLGVHGGAGVSTVDAWMPGGADAHRMWPDPALGGPGLVVLVARTHLSGLTKAAWALRQAATRDIPQGLRVAGVVAVSDGPGDLHRPQRQALRRVEGLAGHLWLMPWIDELRLVMHPYEVGDPHPVIGEIFNDLVCLVEAAAGVHGLAHR